jgi:TRAP-type mannitol/chloroaromatic compound transport system substrate-binding protein
LAAWDKVTAKKAEENPMFKKVLESMRAFAQRSGRWQNDTTIDYRMAWNHYFAPKKKG